MMSRPRIAVLIPDSHYDRVLVGDVPARLNDLGEIVRPSTTTQGLVAVLPDLLESVDICLTGWGTPPLPVTTLGPDARLRLIAHTAGSVRQLIPVEAYAHDIQITHAAPLLADAVAECTLLMILEGLRRVGEMDRRMKAGVPFREAGDVYPGDLLQGQQVGLVGAGYVGRRLIRLLAPFAVDLSVHDPYLSTAENIALGVRNVDLDTLFAENRIVSIHAPSTPETHRMIGARQLGRLAEHAVLVNTARSWSVDQEALLAELARGRIWAALDVFDQEPLPIDHPFRQLNNVLLTPHMAGRSLVTLRRQGEAMVDEIEHWISGKPLRYAVTKAMYPIMA